MCLETILHLFKISTYQGFQELHYLDFQLDLQRITTCKDSKNDNM